MIGEPPVVAGDLPGRCDRPVGRFDSDALGRAGQHRRSGRSHRGPRPLTDPVHGDHSNEVLRAVDQTGDPAAQRSATNRSLRIRVLEVAVVGAPLHAETRDSRSAIRWALPTIRSRIGRPGRRPDQRARPERSPGSATRFLRRSAIAHRVQRNHPHEVLRAIDKTGDLELRRRPPLPAPHRQTGRTRRRTTARRNR